MGLLLTSGQRPPPPPPPPWGSPVEQNRDRQRKFVFYLQEILLYSSKSGTLIVERLETGWGPAGGLWQSGPEHQSGGWFRFSTWKIPRNISVALFFPLFDKPLLEQCRSIVSLQENGFRWHTGTTTPSSQWVPVWVKAAWKMAWKERSSLNQNWPELTQLKLVRTAVRYHEDPWILGAAERRRTAVTSPAVTLAWWIHHDSERKTRAAEASRGVSCFTAKAAICHCLRHHALHPSSTNQWPAVSHSPSLSAEVASTRARGDCGRQTSKARTAPRRLLTEPRSNLSCANVEGEFRLPQRSCCFVSLFDFS